LNKPVKKNRKGGEEYAGTANQFALRTLRLLCDLCGKFFTAARVVPGPPPVLPG
jgi:hypothetical protein